MITVASHERDVVYCQVWAGTISSPSRGTKPSRLLVFSILLLYIEYATGPIKGIPPSSAQSMHDNEAVELLPVVF